MNPDGLWYLGLSMLKSFSYALIGLWDALKSERNFRIQWLCALMVFLLNGLVVFEPWQEITLVLMVFMVLAFELNNSALEKTCDSSGRSFDHGKKRAKDFAAASVLMAAVGAGTIFLALMQSKRHMLELLLHHQPWACFYFIVIFLVLLPLAIRPRKSLVSIVLVSVSALACGHVLRQIFLHTLFAGLALLFYGALLSAIFHATEEP